MIWMNEEKAGTSFSQVNLIWEMKTLQTELVIRQQS